MIASVVIVVLVAALLLFPSLSIASSRLVSWRGGPGTALASAQTLTVIRVEANRSSCVTDARAWLAPPMVTYTPWSVIITLRTTDAYESTNKCAQLRRAPNASNSSLPIVGFYLSGYYLDIPLSEPLGGRALFDGSTFPPKAHP